MINFLTSETMPLIKDLEVFKNFNELAFKVLLPLIIIFLISGYIGMERQNVGKAAGISAHILVAVSATGVAILNRLIFEYQLDLAFAGINSRPEGQRIIAQVIAGVGFIGAGVILKDKANTILGLTTAATIWSVAVIGIILGSGYLFTGTLIGLVIVIFLTIRDVRRGTNPLKPRKIKIDKELEGNKND